MKVWNGPTPYDKPHMSREAHMFARGYRAAMNSPEVRALYERLKLLISDDDWDGDGNKTEAVVEAYEAGMMANSDEPQLPSPPSP